MLAVYDQDCGQKAKQLTSDTLDRTPESIVYIIDVTNIPMKLYHMLFCVLSNLLAQRLPPGCRRP